MNEFTHLHVHSHYSLLNALPKISSLVSTALEYKMKSLALTDDCNLYGAIEFYQKCKKADIKPIIGIDAYVATRGRKDKEARLDNRRTRLVLLAKNYKGYQNLIKLVTDAHLEGFYYKPRIDRETMAMWNENLICVSPAFSGEISHALKMADKEKAHATLDFYKKTYGAENVYLEIVHHPEIDGMTELKEKIIAFAKETNTPLVAAHDVYYLKPEDRDARETLVSVSPTGPRRGAGGFDENIDDFSFKSQEEMNDFFKDLPEAILNTQKIVNECNFEIDLGVWKFPDFEIESGNTPDDELKNLAFEGVIKRNIELTDEVKKRIDYELEVIKTKGYSKYFLVVADLLRFARENGILTTIRGSVAGSMVTYVSGITNVNPMEYKLPFERFLNPERPSAPDIDMDFAEDRRDDVINYAREKYGNEHVAQIGTFGTMLAKGAVRDTARALGYEYGLGDEIAKLIPLGSQGFPMTIERAFDETEDLRNLYESNPDAKRILDMAKKIEGCARHIGVHAAGVVISPDPLTDDTPLQLDPKGGGKLITQYNMHAVGEDGVGLLKFDFLGLKNLAILSKAIKLVKKIEDIDIDIENIPLDDKKTFELLASGETVGLFQLNGSGLTKFLKELKPTTVYDINAMVALYRPGPIEVIPTYIERKHNPTLIEYLDPRMEEILERSFGVITYQDDVMMIAIKLAGYSWLEADKLRKAMGKKIPELMAEQKKKFRDGCIENGLSREKTKELWKLIEPFAAYGFNKAHAASYGRVAYQTAYMKANFPVPYMTALLTADQGDTEKVAEIVEECKRMDIDVLPPDINESFEDFATVGKERRIRFGLTTIKNFGEGIAHIIIDERKSGGPFKSLENLLNRVTDRNLNKKSLEALIKCGALDQLGERGSMVANVEEILEYKKTLAKESRDQGNLFGGMDEAPGLRLHEAPLASMEQKLAWEKELLGLYISGNPLDKFKSQFAGRDSSISTIKDKPKDGKSVVVAGLIDDVRMIKTKKGDDMAFVRVRDFTGSIELVAFPKTFTQYRLLMVTDVCVAFKGKVSLRNGEVSVLIDKAKRLEANA